MTGFRDNCQGSEEPPDLRGSTSSKKWQPCGAWPWTTCWEESRMLLSLTLSWTPDWNLSLLTLLFFRSFVDIFPIPGEVPLLRYTAAPNAGSCSMSLVLSILLSWLVSSPLLDSLLVSLPLILISSPSCLVVHPISSWLHAFVHVTETHSQQPMDTTLT